MKNRDDRFESEDERIELERIQSPYPNGQMPGDYYSRDDEDED